MIAGLSVGSMVLFVCEKANEQDDTEELRERAALVVSVLDATTGSVRVAVFFDINDYEAEDAMIDYREATYSETPAENTWHWPEGS